MPSHMGADVEGSKRLQGHNRSTARVRPSGGLKGINPQIGVGSALIGRVTDASSSYPIAVA
jgi:hypothetical protein